MYGIPEGRPGRRHPALVFSGFLALSLGCAGVLLWGMAADQPWTLLALPPMYLPYWYFKRLPPPV